MSRHPSRYFYFIFDFFFLGVWSPMANQRKKGKKQVGFYASEEERKGLEELAKKRGITVSELLRQIALGLIVIKMLIFGLTTNWSVKALKDTGKAAISFITSKF